MAQPWRRGVSLLLARPRAPPQGNLVPRRPRQVVRAPQVVRSPGWGPPPPLQAWRGPAVRALAASLARPQRLGQGPLLHLWLRGLGAHRGRGLALVGWYQACYPCEIAPVLVLHTADAPGRAQHHSAFQEAKF